MYRGLLAPTVGVAVFFVVTAYRGEELLWSWFLYAA
jgi:hypothetical protein